MALLPILRYPDPRLHKVAARVERVDDKIRRLISDMAQTMYAAPGVGLAAPQVGVAVRIFVVDISVGRKPGELRIFVNPAFLERGGMQLEDEGCLSVPGFTATVARPQRVVLQGLDRQGALQMVEAEGLLARAFQHEMDHLDGRLFIDRLRGIKRDLIVRKIHKLQRNHKW